MDAASRTGLLLLVFVSTLFLVGPGSAEQPQVPSPISATNPFHVFAQWVGQLMAKVTDNDAPCTGDAPGTDDPTTPAEEEPIIEAPAAPPLPPSYQFTQPSAVRRGNPHHVATMTRERLKEHFAFLEQHRELRDCSSG
jgi:hypothetical protein